MRRIGLFAVFLLLLGLTTAVAASFDVQAEDIASFNADVDISVPDPPAVQRTFYVQGGTLPGTLSEVAPTSSAVHSTKFLTSPLEIEEQETPPRNANNIYYFVWKSPALTDGLTLVSQRVQLHVYQNGGAGQVTVGLFDCPFHLADTSVASPACTRLALATQPPELINLGPVSATVQPGRELRLKIVNRSGADWNLQWGYKESNGRTSRIEILEPSS